MASCENSTVYLSQQSFSSCLAISWKVGVGLGVGIPVAVAVVAGIVYGVHRKTKR